MSCVFQCCNHPYAPVPLLSPSVVWSGEDCTSLVTVVDDALRLWKLDSACAAVQGAAATFGAGIAKTEAGCFDPHHQAQFASVHDRSLRAWDFRTAKYDPAFWHVFKSFPLAVFSFTERSFVTSVILTCLLAFARFIL